MEVVEHSQDERRWPRRGGPRWSRPAASPHPPRPPRRPRRRLSDKRSRATTAPAAPTNTSAPASHPHPEKVVSKSPHAGRPGSRPASCRPWNSDSAQPVVLEPIQEVGHVWRHGGTLLASEPVVRGPAGDHRHRVRIAHPKTLTRHRRPFDTWEGQRDARTVLHCA